MNIKKTSILLTAFLIVLPLFAVAQGLVTTIDTVGRIIGLIVPIIGALLLIYFFWGIAQYISAGGDDEKRTAARNMMIYAVIGMFVAFSIFGLVRLLAGTVGISESDIGSSEQLPTFTNFKSKLGI